MGSHYLYARSFGHILPKENFLSPPGPLEKDELFKKAVLSGFPTLWLAGEGFCGFFVVERVAGVGGFFMRLRVLTAQMRLFNFHRVFPPKTGFSGLFSPLPSG
ncbi:hypothetical protein A0127_05680 [Thermococcus peptonophilus]|uniref:Uncharacterized protein n=1 Tax=Thermococcus peptonophilus TaxID=53952 RepID=A0A142CV92_9EURY|nr:hypothetical protein A0127_05680 [Thermococcus peptonophilus]